jgi:nitroreductase
LERAFKPAVDYWIIDASIAAENMILAAQDMGIGSVWLGTYPQMDRVEKQKKLFGLPDFVVPHSIIAFGYPLEPVKEERDLFEADRVHYEKW